MSGTEDRKKDQLPVSYEVGYGKPPAQHRFQKGQSGNPAGRPRGSRNRKSNIPSGPKAADEFLLEEAYRPIMIREGDQMIELPAIQAVFRAMGVSAMKGNRLAQVAMAELVRDVEQERLQLQLENLERFIDYKHRWDEEIERCRKLGIDEPEPIPHPDDIILNFTTGSVDFHGPRTKEEKAKYDAMIERRDEAQDIVSEMKALHDKEPEGRMKNIYLDDWKHEQKVFDILNEALGFRYQEELRDRCYAEGASRKGDMQKKYGFKKPW